MIRFLLALCLTLYMAVPSYSGMVIHTAGPSIQLPLHPGVPTFAQYDYGEVPAGTGIGTYFFSMHLDANETYQIDTNLCGGTCTIWLSSYTGDGTITDRNLLHYQDVQGAYNIVFRIPIGQYLQLLVIHQTFVDGVVTPSILIMRIWNPDPNPPSSTAPAFEWPMGRGPVGMFIEDNLSSAFLPRQDGWVWTEFDEDITSYTFTVQFIYHLMTYDAFWIEPTFGTATYLSTSLNHSVVSGNYFGSQESPIVDPTSTTYSYNFNLPVGSTIDLKLHYIYQIPGESEIREHFVNLVVGNSYGLDPNAITNHVVSPRENVLEIISPESTEAPSNTTGVPTQESPVTIEEVPSDNGASSTLLSAFTVALCALVAFVSL